MTMKIKVFWNATPSGLIEESCLLEYKTLQPVEANRRFGCTYCFHPQDRELSQPKNRHEGGNKQQIYTELKKDLSESMSLKIIIPLRRRAACNFDYRFRGLRSCRVPDGVPLRRIVRNAGPLNTVYSDIWRICSGLSLETICITRRTVQALSAFWALSWTDPRT
jgi:hypothetical protein